MYPPSVDSAFYFIAMLRTPGSANGTQPNFAKRYEVNGADASLIRWRRISNVNEIIEIRSLLSPGPKNFNIAVASRRAAFSGNAYR